MVLRPAREALGMQRGIEAIRWLFMGTALVTLLVNPVFGWLVSRFRRLVFIAATYLFFAASLLVFYGLLVLAPEAVGETSGMVFYVWFSVFNLFATMLFWGLMADRFSLEQSKRLFGVVAVGGTLGAIFGPWLASLLAQPPGDAQPSAGGGRLSVHGRGCGVAGGQAAARTGATHGSRRRRSSAGGGRARDHRGECVGGIPGSG